MVTDVKTPFLGTPVVPLKGWDTGRGRGEPTAHPGLGGSWAVIFIPMPTPKIVCIMFVWKKRVRSEVCRTLFGRGMGIENRSSVPFSSSRSNGLRTETRPPSPPERHEDGSQNPDPHLSPVSGSAVQGKFPADLGIPPLGIENLTRSKPRNSRSVVTTKPQTLLA